MFHTRTFVIIVCHICIVIYTRVYTTIHICDHCIHFALSILFELKKTIRLQSKPFKKMHTCSHKQNAVGSLPSVHHIFPGSARLELSNPGAEPTHPEGQCKISPPPTATKEIRHAPKFRKPSPCTLDGPIIRHALVAVGWPPASLLPPVASRHRQATAAIVPPLVAVCAAVVAGIDSARIPPASSFQCPQRTRVNAVGCTSRAGATNTSAVIADCAREQSFHTYWAARRRKYEKGINRWHAIRAAVPAPTGRWANECSRARTEETRARSSIPSEGCRSTHAGQD